MGNFYIVEAGGNGFAAHKQKNQLEKYFKYISAFYIEHG